MSTPCCSANAAAFGSGLILKPMIIAREVQQGYECGLSVENFNDVKPGDIVEAYAIDKIATKL